MLYVFSILIVTTLLALYAEHKSTIVLPDMFGMPYLYEQRSINRYLFIGLVAIVVCFVGLRTHYNDTLAYRKSFRNLDAGTKALHNIDWTLGNNPGFQTANVLLKTYVSESDYFMLFFYALLSLIPLFIFYRQWSLCLWLTIYLFTATGMLLFSMAAMKQVLAMAFGLSAITCFLTRKRFLFVALVLLGSTFHPYIILYLGAFFIGDRVWSIRVTLIILAAVLGSLSAEYLLQWFYRATALIGEDYAKYGELEGQGVNVVRFIVYSLTPALTWVYRREINAPGNKPLVLFSNFTLIGWCFMLFALFGNANMFARMATYFTPFLHLTLTAILTRFIHQNYRQIIIYACVAGYFLFLAFQLYVSGFRYEWLCG
jgi:hypothetical protein